MSFLKSLFGSVAAIESKPVIDPDVIVMQIHNEVDDLENQSIVAVEKMLAELEIPTEGKLVQKAKLMESLGFNKSNEVVKQSQEIQNKIQETTELKALNEARLKHIAKLRMSYPNDKIIPMSEFKKVLAKYDLIYAPASAYIKDVPEKNLLEIQNSKKTSYGDEALEFKVLSEIQLGFGASDTFKKLLDNIDLSKIILNKEEVEVVEYEMIKTERASEFSNFLKEKGQDITIDYNSNFRWDISWVTSELLGNRYSDYSNYRLYYQTGRSRVSKKLLFNDNNLLDQLCKHLSKLMPAYNSYTIKGFIRNIRTTIVNRSSLFIAAPKTHFDLTNMSSNDGKEFYLSQKVQITEIKDPIAFYILKGSYKDLNEEYIRICSKWGTSDDKSYLDPIVQNENLN